MMYYDIFFCIIKILCVYFFLICISIMFAFLNLYFFAICIKIMLKIA